MAWTETVSPSFTARHEERDDADAVEVLELLEGVRERLAAAFPLMPDAPVAAVLHGSGLALHLAQPSLPLLRMLTAPAGRRYLVGWFHRQEIHVLAPRLLLARASAVAGSREMLLLTPAVLFAQLVVAANNPGLPPPFRPASFARYVRWAWLAAGAAAFFSGQTAFSRPVIARRLREGPAPSLPPGVRDAPLLGGTVFDLLAHEEGEAAAVGLACSLAPGGPRDALRRAFRGRPLAETEAVWRGHLARLAEPSG